MEKFKRHGDGESSEWPERKKRKQKKSIVIKIAKIKGEEHVNHVGKLVNKRQTGKDCRCEMRVPAMSGPTIAAKANIIFGFLGQEGNFYALFGCIHRFKKCHGIRQIGLHGEKLIGDQQAADDFI
ncbi:hypothetical protein FQA39_LY06652 [Lamprigera yunnana]|nr:hypothetical protein FQA39_LY06652 [Lamprigera yunnana]